MFTGEQLVFTVKKSSEYEIRRIIHMKQNNIAFFTPRCIARMHSPRLLSTFQNHNRNSSQFCVLALPRTNDYISSYSKPVLPVLAWYDVPVQSNGQFILVLHSLMCSPVYKPVSNTSGHASESQRTAIVCEWMRMSSAKQQFSFVWARNKRFAERYVSDQAVCK